MNYLNLVKFCIYSTFLFPIISLANYNFGLVATTPERGKIGTVVEIPFPIDSLTLESCRATWYDGNHRCDVQAKVDHLVYPIKLTTTSGRAIEKFEGYEEDQSDEQSYMVGNNWYWIRIYRHGLISLRSDSSSDNNFQQLKKDFSQLMDKVKYRFDLNWQYVTSQTELSGLKVVGIRYRIDAPLQLTKECEEKWDWQTEENKRWTNPTWYFYRCKLQSTLHSRNTDPVIIEKLGDNRKSWILYDHEQDYEHLKGQNGFEIFTIFNSKWDKDIRLFYATPYKGSFYNSRINEKFKDLIANRSVAVDVTVP